MVDIAIPPQYRARVKHRLKVLKYVEDHGSGRRRDISRSAG